MQPHIDIRTLISAALAEDIGGGDITSNATIPADLQAKFAMNARAELVVSGLVYVPVVFSMIDPRITVELLVGEGDKVAPGTMLARISGPARALLVGERTALNLLQQLSGVATLTRQYVDAVAGTGAKILDTRKTIPGWRALQKYAVKCGGGTNHRMGLYDAVLIKDNHIVCAGGVAAAVKAARAYVYELSASGAAGDASPLAGEATRLSDQRELSRSGEGASSEAHNFTAPSSRPSPAGGEGALVAPLVPITIEVECDTLAQLDEALAVGCDIVLLDNMSNDQLRSAVATVRAHNAAQGTAVKTEASGNVSLSTVRAIAETGVDYISVGKLTHSVSAVDIGLDEL